MSKNNRYPRIRTPERVIPEFLDFSTYNLPELSKRQLRKAKRKFDRLYGYRSGDEVRLVVNHDNQSESSTLIRDGKVIMQRTSVTMSGYLRKGSAG